MQRNANLFVQEISYQINKTFSDKSPNDVAIALMGLGYIDKSDGAFLRTQLGEEVLNETSIHDLTEEVADYFREASPLGVERFKCYMCKRLRPEGYFGNNCQFEEEDNETYRVSKSPCNSCLAHYHAGR